MKKEIYGNRGQTLLEALIALTVLVVILGAVATSVLTSINNSSFIKQQNQANKLAQQGMEYIRDRISNGEGTGFDTFFTYAGSGQSTRCFHDLSASTIFDTGVCTAANVPAVSPAFKREATFTSDTCDTGNVFVNGLTVTVNVYWTSGKCAAGSPFCHKQKVVSCFINPSQSLPAGVPTGI